MRSIVSAGLVALMVGCARSKPQTLAVPEAAEKVVASFMKAIADSNLAMIGELWGSAKGPAAATGTPSDWPKRVAIMYAYLHGGEARVLGSAPGFGDENRRQLLVELVREGCTKQVPFTVIRLTDGRWLVNTVDLNAAGVPGRSCGQDAKDGSKKG
jgi:hypothetical protein